MGFVADKPGNVHLSTNITSKVCTGNVIIFTCTAEANPPVHTYLLYENDTVIANMGIPGTFLKKVESDGQFIYGCEANNSVEGVGRSPDIILNVDGEFA